MLDFLVSWKDVMELEGPHQPVAGTITHRDLHDAATILAENSKQVPPVLIHGTKHELEAAQRAACLHNLNQKTTHFNIVQAD